MKTEKLIRDGSKQQGIEQKQSSHNIGKQLLIDHNYKKLKQELKKNDKKSSKSAPNTQLHSPDQSQLNLIPQVIKYDKYDAEQDSGIQNIQSIINDSTFIINQKRKSSINQNDIKNNLDKNDNIKNTFQNKKSIDISNFLPPANPLAPKTHSEEYNIYTAINIRFEQLPEFNKMDKYIFQEPTISLKSLDLIQEKLNSEKNRTLVEYHNQIKDRLVYQRHPNFNLLQNPTKINDKIYFATVLCQLNNLLRSDKKVYLQEQLQKGINLKVIQKQYSLKRFQIRIKSKDYSNNDGKYTQQQIKQDEKHKQLQQKQETIDLTNLISESTVDCINSTTNNQIGSNKINTSLFNNTTSNIILDNSQNDSNIGTFRNNTTNTSNNSHQISENIKDSLIFSSEFESGNLFTAYQVSENNYELILQNDINTKGNTQWFFFRVQNTKKNQTVTFTILNLIKSGSLFNNGLCPVVFSQKKNEEKGSEWVRDGSNIRYYKNNIFRDGFRMNKFYHSLTFQYTFQYNQDTVYFSHSFPYTYSNLQEDLNKIMIDKEKSQYISRKILCTTLSGNQCDSLTITSINEQKRELRKGIVIFSRQHPGETGGSFIMKGIIDFLLSKNPEAEYLRDACIFKIIPMLNPDGVIHGNYRCDLAGSDLNRRWKKPNKKLHPSVYSMKELVKKFHSEREIKLILDLHGHSRKQNYQLNKLLFKNKLKNRMEAFFYGCSYKEDPIKTRIFPFLLSQVNSKVSFRQSRFSMNSQKESTARISLWKELKIPNVFTLEASFYGYQRDKTIDKNQIKNNEQKINYSTKSNIETISSLIQTQNKDQKISQKYSDEQSPQENKHFTIQDYLDIGRDICINLYNIMQQEKSKDNKGELMIDQNSNCHAQLQEIFKNKELLEIGDQSDSGSDSNPSEDGLDDEELLDIIPKSVLNKKQKQILNERLKKEQNDKSKKVSNQIVQEQNTQQVQMDQKRKQLNQMYLKRYLQKQQNKDLNKIPVSKQDQEQQTDVSFLHDLYIYMEKKKQFLLNKSEQRLSKQSSYSNINFNDSLDQQKDKNNSSNHSYVKSSSQNINQNNSIINKPIVFQSLHNINSNMSSSTNQLNKIKKTDNINSVSLNQTIFSKNVDTSSIQSPLQRQQQSGNDETQNNSITMSRKISIYSQKKEQPQYSFIQFRVKSVDQSKSQIIQQNNKYIDKNKYQFNNINLNQNMKYSIIQNTSLQQNQKQIQQVSSINQSLQKQNNIINKETNNLQNKNSNRMPTVNENQNLEDQVQTDHSPQIDSINNDLILQRKRQGSINFRQYSQRGMNQQNNEMTQNNYKILDDNIFNNLKHNNVIQFHSKNPSPDQIEIKKINSNRMKEKQEQLNQKKSQLK